MCWFLRIAVVLSMVLWYPCLNLVVVAKNELIQAVVPKHISFDSKTSYYWVKTRALWCHNTTGIHVVYIEFEIVNYSHVLNS